MWEWFLAFILTFGLCIISFSYMCGFMFTDPRTSFKLMPLILYFGTFILPSILLLIAHIINDQVYHIAQYLTCWLPMTAFMQGSLSFISNYYSFGNILDAVITQPFECVLVFLVDFAAFMIITVILENRFLRAKKGPPGSIRAEISSDNGVITELNRVRTADDIVKVMQLQTIYPNGFAAVKSVSFGLGKGRIFGLLGPNGAGKSTTIGVVTKDIGKSGGDVLVEGVDVDLYEPKFGFCPQYNPLYEKLTVREHLKMIARVRGCKDDDVINYYISAMNLGDFEGRQAGQLSGGNKRKLTVAMSLLANPSIQLYDEPSTGLDPIAKRYLWQNLKDTKNEVQCGMLLTTHSMEEAENLCDSIGIVVNGSMQCVGTPQQLRSKYGKGYNVHITLTSQFEPSSYWSFVNENFPGAQQVSTLLEDFIVPKEGFLLSRAFRAIQAECHAGNISDFAISQASLHQVFLTIAKQQVASS